MILLKPHRSKFYLTYILIVSLTFLFTSCSSYCFLTQTAKTISSHIKSEFQNTYDYQFDKQVYVLERNETLILDVGFSIPSDYNSYDMFQFFLDSELTIPVWKPTPIYTVNDTKVSIAPNPYPLFHTELDEFPATGENANWGNIGTLYLAKYFDEKGHLQDTPQSVSIIKIKTELPQPIVHLSTTSDGYAMLSWQPIEGANKYSIYTISLYNNEITEDELLMLYGSTTDTYFKDFNYFTFNNSARTGINTNNIISINVDFLLGDHPDSSIYTEGFVVIAEGPNGKSEMSQIIKPQDYAALLPYAPDYETLNTSSLELPHDFPIKMCNGSTVYYDIVYDLNSIDEYTGYDKIPEKFTRSDKKLMTILGHIQGTPFEQVFYFVCYQDETPEHALKRVLSSLAQTTKPSAGFNSPASIITVTDENQLPATSHDTSFDLDHRISITATNPLSKYLAYNLLNGNTYIPLDDFPEAADSSYLVDALTEALYQNPLIQNIDTFSFNPYTNHLMISYTVSEEQLKQRQNNLLDVASHIIDTIIHKDMSVLDKERAINDYLCDTVIYDTEALESSKENDYAACDPIYDDSFTAYGALVNKVCVCKGYAQAFKLLADLAGIDSIVVTGNLKGVGHAWNKVNINGNWLTLDVTNNDSDLIPNAIFNLPEYLLASTYIPDDAYILDAHLNDFPDSRCLDYEYYHLIDSYYEKEAIVQIIKTNLLTSSEAFCIRTDYNISEEEVETLITTALDSLPPSINSDVYYASSLGVIYVRAQ